MKLIPYKPLSAAGVMLVLTLTYLTAAQAANYSVPAPGVPGQIHLDNVTLVNSDGTSGGSSGALLNALDDHPLYGGQIFQLAGAFPVAGSEDAGFTGLDSKLIIPKLLQSALFSHNLLLLKTNTSPLQLTVTALSSSSFTNGAETRIIFNQGNKGDTGATGPQGPIGLTGAADTNGTNGADGLTTSVNGVTQVGGAITLTKANIGLDNVDNTSDLNKPVSTATQAALDLKANLASPTLTGTPAAPTAGAGDNSIQIATTAFVTNAVTPATHTIGEAFGGGIVFYVTPNGTHGLVAATQDLPKTTWFLAQDVISTVSSHDTAGQAFTDWRLPTKNELNLLYLQRVVVDGFAGGDYCSSTEYDAGSVWLQAFGNGGLGSGGKSGAWLVRAVRAF